MRFKRWISIVLALVLAVTGGFFWEHWLPTVAAFTLRQQTAPSWRRVGMFLLKNTDPVMKNISRYLVPEQEEAPDELFLYFTEE